MATYSEMLTCAHSCVAFLKSRTGEDIFNVAKLRRGGQADDQLVQHCVHVGGFQVSRSNGGRPTFIHFKDVCYKQANRAPISTKYILLFPRVTKGETLTCF